MRQNLGEMERRQNSFDDLLGSQVYERSTRAEKGGRLSNNQFPLPWWPPALRANGSERRGLRGGGNKEVGEYSPSFPPPPMPSPIKGEGSLGLPGRLEGPF